MKKTNYIYKLSKDQKKNHNKGKLTLVEYLTFIVIFVILVPWILFKLKLYFILIAYLPNLDLVATVLSYSKISYFNHIYNLKTETDAQEYSQISINYMALLGLIYLVLKEANISKKIHHGWSLAVVMVLVTYLLPNELIVLTLKKTDDLNKYFFGKNLENIKIMMNIFVGVLTVILIIVFEAIIVKYFRKELIYGSYILLVWLPKYLNGS